LLPLAVLLLAVGLLRPWENRLAAAATPSVQLRQLGGNGVLGVLGGMRAAVASGFWLRTNQAWEQQDAAETVALLNLTVAADERPLYFWLNGARMLAYDLPAWRVTSDMPEAVRRKAAAEGADTARTFLARGLQSHPNSPELMIELANIELRVSGDREAAAGWFRRAAEQPGAPYFAARIHAELLRSFGRPEEALAWLRQILPGLPAHDPAAARFVVEQRIKTLEAERDGK
jgi:hypothetical protein